MDLLLAALLVGFFVPTVVRAVMRGSRGEGAVVLVRESLRHPSLIVHGVGLALVYFGAIAALVLGHVARAPAITNVIGAVLVVLGMIVLGWSVAVLRSWRLLPRVDPDDELCTTGPYAWVRHPMYVAIDLLALGVAVWIHSVIVVAATALVAVGGELRARVEERALVGAYGDRYREYMRYVGRFIPSFRHRAPRAGHGDREWGTPWS